MRVRTCEFSPLIFFSGRRASVRGGFAVAMATVSNHTVIIHGRKYTQGQDDVVCVAQQISHPPPPPSRIPLPICPTCSRSDARARVAACG